MTFEHYAAGAWHDSTSNTVLTAGSWYHVAATFDTVTDTVRYYLNGKDDGSAVDTTALVADANAIDIGTNAQCDDNFDGIMDDVRIYNRALTAGEIKQLYTAGR